MPASSVRIGLIGAGKNTRERHIPGFQAIDGVEVVSVCNRSRESSQRVADQFSIPKVIENWQDLVADDDIDAVCIGTWPYLHCPMTLASLDNEKHVMTEARMAMNAGEAHDMLDAANASPGLVTQVVPSPFTFAIDETIRSLVVDGYLGDVLAIDMNVNGNQFLERDAPVSWRHDRDLSGLNIMHMGIWYEALLRWVGPASEVMAMTSVNVPLAPGRRRQPGLHHRTRSCGRALPHGRRGPGPDKDQLGYRAGPGVGYLDKWLGGEPVHRQDGADPHGRP